MIIILIIILIWYYRDSYKTKKSNCKLNQYERKKENITKIINEINQIEDAQYN